MCLFWKLYLKWDITSLYQFVITLPQLFRGTLRASGRCMSQTLKELASFPKQLQFSHPVLAIHLLFYIYVCVHMCTNKYTCMHMYNFNFYSLESNSRISLVYWIMHWTKAGMDWFKLFMVSEGAFILVLDFSHQGEKVQIPLATMFCTCSLLWSVSSRDLGQPLLEARMINLETCKLFFKTISAASVYWQREGLKGP